MKLSILIPILVVVSLGTGYYVSNIQSNQGFNEIQQEISGLEDTQTTLFSKIEELEYKQDNQSAVLEEIYEKVDIIEYGLETINSSIKVDTSSDLHPIIDEMQLSIAEIKTSINKTKPRKWVEVTSFRLEIGDTSTPFYVKFDNWRIRYEMAQITLSGSSTGYPYHISIWQEGFFPDGALIDGFYVSTNGKGIFYPNSGSGSYAIHTIVGDDIKFTIEESK